MILLQIQLENNFLPTSKHPQAKVRHFLGICFYECFIYRSNKCLETRCHLGFGGKTVNSQGYSQLREPIKTCEKLLFTDLVNTGTKTVYVSPSYSSAMPYMINNQTCFYSKIAAICC